MEMNQARYFAALCETLNFTRAAQRCNVSQPSLTRAIQLLEGELGGKLFNRERGHTHLTELGVAMRPHLVELLAQAGAARERAATMLTLRTARLKLGLGHGVALAHLGDALARFAGNHPDTEIALVDGCPTSLHRALRRGELELAVLPDRPHDIDDLHYHAIGTDRAWLLARPDHRLAGQPHATLADLAAEPLIAHEGCLFLQAIERRLGGRGQGLAARVTAASPAWLPDLARSGLGVAVTGRRFGVPVGLVGREIVDLPGEWPVYLATRRGRPYSPPVRAFVELALQPLRRARAAGIA